MDNSITLGANNLRIVRTIIRKVGQLIREFIRIVQDKVRIEDLVRGQLIFEVQESIPLLKLLRLKFPPAKIVLYLTELVYAKLSGLVQDTVRIFDQVKGRLIEYIAEIITIVKIVIFKLVFPLKKVISLTELVLINLKTLVADSVLLFDEVKGLLSTTPKESIGILIHIVKRIILPLLIIERTMAISEGGIAILPTRFGIHKFGEARFGYWDRRIIS